LISVTSFHLLRKLFSVILLYYYDIVVAYDNMSMYG